jgi:hypothetical protein
LTSPCLSVITVQPASVYRAATRETSCAILLYMTRCSNLSQAIVNNHSLPQSRTWAVAPPSVH